jgi:hypothetical protein
MVLCRLRVLFRRSTVTTIIRVKLNEGSPNALTDDEVLAIMSDFVERPETAATAASHREVGHNRWPN